MIAKVGQLSKKNQMVLTRLSVATTTSKMPLTKMVAVSIEEGIEPGGEVATRALPDNYRPALSDDVPQGRACGNCFF